MQIMSYEIAWFDLLIYSWTSCDVGKWKLCAFNYSGGGKNISQFERKISKSKTWKIYVGSIQIKKYIKLFKLSKFTENWRH